MATEILYNARFCVMEIRPGGYAPQGEFSTLWDALRAAQIMETEGLLLIRGSRTPDGKPAPISWYTIEMGAVRGLLAGDPSSRPPRKGLLSEIRAARRAAQRPAPIAGLDEPFYEYESDPPEGAEFDCD